MEIRDPKLYEAIMNMPSSFELYKEQAKQRFDKIEEQIEDCLLSGQIFIK